MFTRKIMLLLKRRIIIQVLFCIAVVLSLLPCVTFFVNFGKIRTTDYPGSRSIQKVDLIQTNTVPVSLWPSRKLAIPLDDNSIAVLVLVANRPIYAQKTILGIVENRKLFEDSKRLHIIVSQDGGNAEITAVITKFASIVSHIKFPSASMSRQQLHNAYYRITSHYGWALHQVFDIMGFNQAIIIEEDIMVSVDFMSYMTRLLEILKTDVTLYCVSAWNDHGQSHFVRNATRLFRTEVFPGLGWMMLKTLWQEIKHKWPQVRMHHAIAHAEHFNVFSYPKAYWDEFMRTDAVRKNRHCIRPEINRAYTFGQEGTSKGQFYERYLSPIKLNSADVMWSNQDTSYLRVDSFDHDLKNKIKGAQELEFETLKALASFSNKTMYRIRYRSMSEYRVITKSIGLLSESKGALSVFGPLDGNSTFTVTGLSYWKLNIFLQMCESKKVIGAVEKVSNTSLQTKKNAITRLHAAHPVSCSHPY